MPACAEKNANSLKQCLINSFTLLVPRYKEGYPELNIPKLDPFTLNRTVFVYNFGPIKGKFVIVEASVSGLTNMEFQDVGFSMKDEKHTQFYMKSFAPHVTIVGKYKADLAINQARLKPKGDFRIEMSKLQNAFA